MAQDLYDLNEILDKAEDSEALEEAIRTAIQALLFHQIIYDDTHTVPGAATDAVKTYRTFFEKFFSAAGFDLVLDNRSQMIALRPQRLEKPPYGWRQTRLKKDETLLRLGLRHIFEQGFINGTMDETGRVHSDTAEITDLYRTMAKADPPSENYLLETLLRDLQRRGAVRVGERDKEARVTKIMILPGIRVLIPDEFVAQIERWLDSGAHDSFLSRPEPVETTDV